MLTHRCRSAGPAEAMGPNLMAPDHAAPALGAGYRQGRELAARR
jgi:hypothetical protein